MQGNVIVAGSEFFILGVVVAFGIAVLAGVLLYRIGLRRGYLEAEAGHDQALEEARRDAIERSRAVLSGQLSEQLAPYLPDFPAHPAEARFIGKPVDFIAFAGLEKGEVEEIVFIEVKTGRSTLSPVEKSIREAIVRGRVRWVEYRI